MGLGHHIGKPATTGTASSLTWRQLTARAGDPHPRSRVNGIDVSAHAGAPGSMTFPKIELHVHLEGTVRARATARSMSRGSSPPLRQPGADATGMSCSQATATGLSRPPSSTACKSLAEPVAAAGRQAGRRDRARQTRRRRAIVRGTSRGSLPACPGRSRPGRRGRGSPGPSGSCPSRLGNRDPV